MSLGSNLTSLQAGSPQDGTLLTGIQHFFTMRSMIELFGADETSMCVLEMQAFCQANTETTLMTLSSSKYDIMLNNAAFLESFNDHRFFSLNDLASTELAQITTALSKNYEMAALAAPECTDLWRALYPNLFDLVNDYELALIEDDGSMIDELSTPDTKLYYPEPFIASPSFVHEDLWFIHILHYQHWLWFMFISLIMFYFITFVSVVRWCNLRTKPKRETRGVSRSKCADLITATVPVTWAASIIISESVDAADYYDGFGSGEIVIGIRAYQWGWEYFYPKGIDLNYNVTPSYSSMVGNSLKYTTTNSNTVKSNTLWKYYQNRNNNKTTSTPAHLILSPSDNAKILNFMKFSDVGSSSVKDSTAFKKIQSFSKTNPQQLYSNISEFNLKYKKISDLYLSDIEPSTTFAYGTKRQHNYTSAASLTSSSNSLLDSKSLKTFLDYNHSVTQNNKKLNLNQSIKLSQPEDNSFATTNTTTLNSKLNDVLNTSTLKSNDPVKNYVNFLNKNGLLSAHTDSKQFKNPFKYALNQKWSKKNFLNSRWSLDSVDKSEVSVASPISNFSTKFSNQELSPRFKDLKSPGTSLLTSERNVRLVNNFALGNTNKNFDSSNNNLTTNLSNNFNQSAAGLQEHMFTSMSLNWATKDSATRLVNNTTTLPASHTPVSTINASQYSLYFDRFNKGEDDLTPNLLKSKEESAPNHVFNTYWLTYWATSNQSHRYSNNDTISETLSKSYLPSFHEYAEYDFKNWQALELLEDAFWESTYSAFSQDDYLNILQDATDHDYFKKQEEIFNTTDRHKKFRGGLLSKPFFRDLNTKTNLNSLPIFSEDSVPNSFLLGLKNFNNFSTENSFDTLEDSYESFKYINYIHYLNYKTLLNTSTSNLQPLSYTQIIDNFRADYEDNSWFSDNLSSSEVLYGNNLDVKTSADLRVSNPMKLRSSTRSAIVTYNAIQKVFKSRFDENRSHARLQDFSNSYVSHPFLTEKKTPYESLLAKNKESFFNVNSFKQTIQDNFNENMLVWNSMNTYFADVPFLLSMKSDASRYLWFDWQSRWSSIEIQPSSVARYSLLGLPYVNKSFEYTTGVGDEINDSENYLIKLSRARKNYMSNWARTPYFYARVSNWYKTPSNMNSLFSETSLKNTKTSLLLSHKYWSEIANSSFVTNLSTPSSSGVSTPGRSSWRPATSIQSYYYNSSILVDILTKREYLYRQYFAHKSYTTALPKYLTAAPNNPLLEEVKASYPLIDPVVFSSELTREIFYSNTNFLKFMIIKDILNIVNSNIKNSSVNLSGVTNYLFFYLFNTDSTSSDLSRNTTLYKSQFRPMKKGVTNMIRLHATSAIAMPIETRLHILASSKDVIHSWSIPSAGIKIDCVPGYSSHRITIFLVTGIFWGQCMEICGRFHHWMPIIVYFMKKDLFFLWCTHFMHYSSIDSTFNMTDRQFIDHVKLVSYDKSTWVHEFSKTF